MKKMLTCIKTRTNEPEIKGWINHYSPKEGFVFGNLGKEIERLKGNGIYIIPRISGFKVEIQDDQIFRTDGEISLEHFNGKTTLKCLSGTYLIIHKKGMLKVYISSVSVNIVKIINELKKI